MYTLSYSPCKNGSLPENTLNKLSSAINGSNDTDNGEYELSKESETDLDDQSAQTDDRVMIRVQKMFLPKSEERDGDMNEADI